MAAATGNAGIMITIYSALDWFIMNYVKILSNVPLILSFGISNNWYESYLNLVMHGHFLAMFMPLFSSV